jgi:hypothetical protein
MNEWYLVLLITSRHEPHRKYRYTLPVYETSPSNGCCLDAYLAVVISQRVCVPQYYNFYLFLLTTLGNRPRPREQPLLSNSSVKNGRLLGNGWVAITWASRQARTQQKKFFFLRGPWRDAISRTVGAWVTRVEEGSNTSIVTLRVVEDDEKGSLKSETVKYGHESQGTRIRERLRWWGPTAYTKDRFVISSERAPQKNKTVTVRE